MNHVWLVTIKTAGPKRKLLVAGKLPVKDKLCYVLHLIDAEVRL